MQSCRALLLAALGTTLPTAGANPPWPLTFSAYLRSSNIFFPNPAAGTPLPNVTREGAIGADADQLMLRTADPMPDGRSITMIEQLKVERMVQETPFFGESACYEFQDPISNATAAFHDRMTGYFGVPRAVYENTSFSGRATVDGRACDVYAGNMMELYINVTVSFCVDLKTGALLSYNGSSIANVHGMSWKWGEYSMVFANHTMTPPPGYFEPPANCLNFSKSAGRPKGPSHGSTRLNDPRRLRQIQRAARGRWQAAPTSAFGPNATIATAAATLGTKLGLLRLPAAPQLAAAAAPQSALPEQFDARTRWAECPTISTIRNQGSCGSCWSFAAVEVLADRTCIASAAAGGNLTNLTLSVEFMLDCDANDHGCGGGYLDDAWQFLVSKGVPLEGCDPYTHCPDPATTSCQPPPPATVEQPLGAPACPSTCRDGQPLRLRRAAHAYAVGKPGDAAAMQREIMEKGPIQVAFYVWPDFMNYKNGTYVATGVGDVPPEGGHSVRLLGWGVDAQGVDYWIAANSWSSEWGMDGFFHIRRGHNECGVETTPAAGAPLL